MDREDKRFDYKQLNDLLHSRIRLAIVSILTNYEEVEFTYLRDSIGATDGNLNTHLKKLEDAKYIRVRKIFIERKPRTFYSLTNEGNKAFRDYISHIERFIK